MKIPSHLMYRVAAKFLPRIVSLKTKSSFKKLSLQKSILLLSFDCDTEEDAKVALDVHQRLLKMGICATYAVPGEILLKSKDV